MSEIRTFDNRTIFIRFPKPNDRYSDVHCMYFPFLLVALQFDFKINFILQVLCLLMLRGDLPKAEARTMALDFVPESRQAACAKSIFSQVQVSSSVNPFASGKDAADRLNPFSAGKDAADRLNPFANNKPAGADLNPFGE